LERSDHRDSREKCIEKTKYASVASAYLSGVVSEELIDLHAGLLLGVKEAWFGSGPPGQFPFLCLAFAAWNPLYPTGFMGDKPIVFKPNGFHLEVRPENDYFKFLETVIEKLDPDYQKPILLEFFTMRNMIGEESEEMIETQIESYFEALNRLRSKHPKLYVLLGPCVSLKIQNYTDDEYTVSSLRLVKLNNMLSIWSIKYNVPFFSTMGFINPIPQKVKDEYWWTRARQHEDEPLYNMYGEVLREFTKRFGFVADVIAECHQTAITIIKEKIDKENKIATLRRLERNMTMPYEHFPKRKTVETDVQIVPAKRQINTKERKISPVEIAMIHAENTTEYVEIEPSPPPNSPEEGEIVDEDEAEVGTSQDTEQVTMSISNKEVTVVYSKAPATVEGPKEDETVPDEPSPEFSPLPDQTQVRLFNIISENR
jgi:hypothetical protein